MVQEKSSEREKGPSILITRPEQGETVQDTFTVYGTFSPQYANAYVQCQVHYPQKSGIPPYPQNPSRRVIPNNGDWNYLISGAPQYQGAEVWASAYDAPTAGTMLASYQQTNVTISNAAPPREKR